MTHIQKVYTALLILGVLALIGFILSVGNPDMDVMFAWSSLILLMAIFGIAITALVFLVSRLGHTGRRSAPVKSEDIVKRVMEA
jgi:hypothetical protein